jgi:hypothetical protein
MKKRFKNWWNKEIICPDGTILRRWQVVLGTVWDPLILVFILSSFYAVCWLIAKDFAKLPHHSIF